MQTQILGHFLGEPELAKRNHLRIISAVSLQGGCLFFHPVNNDKAPKGKITHKDSTRNIVSAEAVAIIPSTTATSVTAITLLTKLTTKAGTSHKSQQARAGTQRYFPSYLSADRLHEPKHRPVSVHNSPVPILGTGCLYSRLSRWLLTTKIDATDVSNSAVALN